MHITSPIRTKDTVDTLARLWEASVRRSHHFLTEADIRRLTPFVKSGLGHIERLFVTYVQNVPAGFIGLEKNKIEMLFIAPDFWGMGIGKELVLMAFRKFNIRYVDVNEQNPQAEGFYRHLGFRTFERTETDGQGNPFPILKMERERFSLRHATPEDIPVLKTLFTDTVLHTNRKDYTQEEVEDWAACADKPGHWKELIATHHLTLAEKSPGHTVGSICFIGKDIIFSGDTLFQGSCGRTDLPTGDWDDIKKSLKRLAALPGDYQVYSGHGPATTLETERRTNPYMR